MLHKHAARNDARKGSVKLDVLSQDKERGFRGPGAESAKPSFGVWAFSLFFEQKTEKNMGLVP